MNALEIIARAYDREDSALRGEPDPWHPDIGGDDAEWVSERLACALGAVSALTDAGYRILGAEEIAKQDLSGVGAVVVARARDLLERVMVDGRGEIVGGKLVGGNGGILSQDTMKAADRLASALAAFDAARDGGGK